MIASIKKAKITVLFEWFTFCSCLKVIFRAQEFTAAGQESATEDLFKLIEHTNVDAWNKLLFLVVVRPSSQSVPLFILN